MLRFCFFCVGDSLVSELSGEPADKEGEEDGDDGAGINEQENEDKDGAEGEGEGGQTEEEPKKEQDTRRAVTVLGPKIGEQTT